MRKILFENNKNIISKSLKLNRIKNNLSQSQLAAKMQTMGVNLDQQMVSKIERNARIVTDYELACFCVVLGVDIQDMLREFQKGLEKSSWQPIYSDYRILIPLLKLLAATV